MKIVTFSTYRTIKLLHGGQIRLNAIHDTLRRDGFQIKHVSVHTSDCENIHEEELSFPLDLSMQTHLHENKLRADVHACTLFDKDKDKYAELEAALNEFEADVFWLEQPWLWPVIKEYLEVNKQKHTTVVYGSQNVEFRLTDATAAEWDDKARSRLTREVEDLENDLCKHAHGIVAVSASDAKHFEKFGKSVLLAPNGVWPMQQPSGQEYWANFLRHSAIALFVGSAHPPNAEGFAAMLGEDLSFMAPNEKIAMIGGVCHLLQNGSYFRRSRGLVLPRLLMLNNQDSGVLSTFFNLSRAIILPIISGGGTNLKTAEALYSRKPIIATTRAFRGYETYIDFPNIHISDDPKQFRSILKQRLSDDSFDATFTDNQATALDDLLWSRTLAPVGRWTRQAAKEAQVVASQRAALSNFTASSRKSSKELLTSEGALLKPLLHTGWHDFEGSGTWSKERVATLKIKNPFSNYNINVSIDIEVLVARGDKNAIDIYTASAHHVSKICDYRNRRCTFAFLTTANDFGNDNSLELYVQVQKLSKPASSGQTIDERRLGCRVMKIDLMNVTTASSSRELVIYRKQGLISRLRQRLGNL